MRIGQKMWIFLLLANFWMWALFLFQTLEGLFTAHFKNFHLWKKNVLFLCKYNHNFIIQLRSYTFIPFIAFQERIRHLNGRKTCFSHQKMLLYTSFWTTEKTMIPFYIYSVENNYCIPQHSQTWCSYSILDF